MRCSTIEFIYRWITVLINPIRLILIKRRPSIIGVLTFCLFAGLLIAPQACFAETALVVLEETSSHQKKFLSLLKKSKSKNSQRSIKSLSLQALSKNNVQQYQADIIISLGENTSEKLIELNLNIPTIHTLLTQSDAKALAPCLPVCRKQRPFDRFLVLDQPNFRQLRLIQLIKPSTKNIGVFYTQDSSMSLKLIKQAAKSSSIVINEHATQPSSLGFQLNDVARASDIILALADTSIYNTSTLPQILLTSYRHQTPVVGFSRGFVKAGAISAVVSDIPQFVDQLSEILDIFPEPYLTSYNSLIYPKYFNVVSNRNVAKSLHLIFPSDLELTTTLQVDEAYQ